VTENNLMQEKVTQLLSLRVVREQNVPYCDPEGQLTSPEIAAKLFDKVFGLSEHAEEVLCMISLDTRNRPSGFWRVSAGSLTESIVHPREVFKRALVTNAHSVVIAHNHPSGDPGFSPQDRACAKKLQEAGKILGVRLLDFLAIGAKGRYESAAEQGVLKQC